MSEQRQQNKKKRCHPRKTKGSLLARDGCFSIRIANVAGLAGFWQDRKPHRGIKKKRLLFPHFY